MDNLHFGQLPSGMQSFAVAGQMHTDVRLQPTADLGLLTQIVAMPANRFAIDPQPVTAPIAWNTKANLYFMSSFERYLTSALPFERHALLCMGSATGNNHLLRR